MTITERKRISNAEYYIKNKDRINEQAKEYRLKNREKLLAYDRLRSQDEGRRESCSLRNRERYLMERDVRIQRQAAYHAANRDEILIKNKARYRADPRTMMLASARKRAKKYGLPFTINVNDIVVPAVCPALGEPLVIGDGGSHDWSPSLDRIIPELGYVPGNIMVISQLANSIKNKATAEQVRAVADFLSALGRLD